MSKRKDVEIMKEGGDLEVGREETSIEEGNEREGTSREGGGCKKNVMTSSTHP